MDTTINLWQLIVFAISMLVMVIGAWIKLEMKIQRLETEVKYLKSNEEETKGDIKWIRKSLEDIKLLIAKGGIG